MRPNTTSTREALRLDGFPRFDLDMSITHGVDGNKKGVFTSDRRPKRVVAALRERWTSPQEGPVR